jgi:hypothetical protein
MNSAGIRSIDLAPSQSQERRFVPRVQLAQYRRAMADRKIRYTKKSCST